MGRPDSYDPADARREDLLEDLVAHCLAARERHGDAAVARVCERHPDQAEVLRRRIELLGPLGGSSADGSAGTAASDEGVHVPERLGEYRLLRCLGGGGMGVVYLAERDPAGERVAVKVVRPDLACFPGTRRRFRREIELASRLRHDGIVRMIAVGEDGGIPFFAMEHLVGANLADVIESVRGRPPATLTGTDLARHLGIRLVDLAPEDAASFAGSWAESCVRIVLRVAEALEYAHAQGIVHRDVKPSNVMVTATGRVVLIDFGLAWTAEAERLTASATRLGSLAYMAPEQLRGARDLVDRRTDVYALGVTLFELLALELPFAGPPGEAMRAQILAGRVGDLRALNAAASWAVETVCRTAMDVDPDRRYQCAADLAADLRRALGTGPVLARRAGLVLRLRRAARRRPAAALALALAAVLVVGGPAALYIQERRANARIRAQQAVVEEFGLGSLEVVDRLLTRIGESTLAAVPGQSALRAQLLGDAAAYYERFLAAGELGERFAIERAWARAALAELELELGRVVRAAGDARAARIELETLAAAAPADDALRQRLQRALVIEARTLRQRGEHGRAEQLFQRALDAETDRPPGDPRRQAELETVAAVLRARAVDPVRPPDERDEAWALRAAETLRELRAIDPENARWLREAFRAESALAEVLVRRHEPHRAEPRLLAAAELFAALGARGPVAAADRARYVVNRALLGGHLVRSGRRAEGEAELRAAVDEGRALRAAFGELLEDHWCLVEALVALGTYRMAERGGDGRRLLVEAIALGDDLATRGAATPGGLAMVAGIHGQLADRLLRTDPQAAERHYREAWRVGDDLAAAFPASAETHGRAGLALGIADALAAQRRFDEAEAAFTGAIARLDAALLRDPADLGALRAACRAHHRLGALLLARGRTDDALRELRTGLERARRLARTEPAGEAVVRAHAHRLAEALIATGELAEACDVLAAAPPPDRGPERGPRAPHPGLRLADRLLDANRAELGGERGLRERAAVVLLEAARAAPDAERPPLGARAVALLQSAAARGEWTPAALGSPPFDRLLADPELRALLAVFER